MLQPEPRRGGPLADVLSLGADVGAVTGWLRILLGAGLSGVALKTWLSQHASSEPPAWMRSIRDSEPADAGRPGVVLSVANPKVLLLAIAVGGVIALEIRDLGAQAIAVLAFATVASVTVVAPLLTYLVLGERALSTLRHANTWLDRNSQALVAAVLLVIGVSLLLGGVQTLAGSGILGTFTPRHQRRLTPAPSPRLKVEGSSGPSGTS
ncbi:MAG: GAP family protein [Actinomycetia bacterium]|nr:GAP family protein [Actinomycetes bacterium]